MEVVLIIFPVVLVIHTDRNNTKEKGLMLAHSSRLHSIMVGKLQHDRTIDENNRCLHWLSPLVQNLIPENSGAHRRFSHLG